MPPSGGAAYRGPLACGYGGGGGFCLRRDLFNFVPELSIGKEIFCFCFEIMAIQSLYRHVVGTGLFACGHLAWHSTGPNWLSYSAIHQSADPMVTGRSMQTEKMSIGCEWITSLKSVPAGATQSSGLVNSAVKYL